MTGGCWGGQRLSTMSQPPCCKPSCKELAPHCISSRLQQLLILFRDICSFLGGIWTILLSRDIQLLICDPPQHWDGTAGMATITHHRATFPACASTAFSGSHHRPPTAHFGGGQPCLGTAGGKHATGSCGLAAHPQHSVPSALWAQHSWGEN